MEKDKALESLHQQAEEIKQKKVKLLSEYKYFENIQNGLTFSQALEAVKRGLAISRRGWNGKGLYVMMYNTDFLSTKLLLMVYPDNKLYAWEPNTFDLLANDWEVSLHD